MFIQFYCENYAHLGLPGLVLVAPLCADGELGFTLRNQRSYAKAQVADREASLSWSEKVAYACSCGVQYSVQRQRWVDADEDPRLRERMVRDGPVQGKCPNCGESAMAKGVWLELYPRRRKATLVLGPHHRSELVSEIQAHVSRVATRLDRWDAWLMRPDWRFESEAHVRMRDSADAENGARPGVPLAVGTETFASKRPPSSVQDALVTGLGIDGDTVTIVVQLGEAERKTWGPAAVRARPIHLSNHGYPLVGVRVIASYLGQTSIIDGIVDVGSEIAGDIFGHLSREFRLQLIVNDDSDEVVIRREVAATGLERNAALCIESARGALASGEFPPSAFVTALQKLEMVPRDTRMRTAKHSLAPGAYLHLMAPRETWLALADLNEVSKKKNLDQLLQVDGLPVAEYESIRKRVLQASMDQGLCAPSRFWRRIIDSGLAKSHQEYVSELVAARSRIVASGEDDLDPDQIKQACALIIEYCRRKNIPSPDIDAELQRATKQVEKQKSETPSTKVKKVVPRSVPPNSQSTGNPQARVPSPVVTSISGEIGTSRDLDDEFAAYFDLEGIPSTIKPIGVDPTDAESPGQSNSPTPSAAPTPPTVASPPPPPPPPPIPPTATSSSLAPPIIAKSPSGGIRTGGKNEVIKGKPNRIPSFSKPKDEVKTQDSTSQSHFETKQAALQSEESANTKNGSVVAPTVSTGSNLAISEPFVPSERAKNALELLESADAGKQRDIALREVFKIWDKCEDEEILAFLPGLAKAGKVAVPRLIFKLVSPRQELRQAAAILLGIISDEAAIAPLCTRLMREQSQAWIDMARALAMYGERAVSDLSGVIAEDTTLDHEHRKARACRALAELAVVGLDSKAHASPQMLGVLQKLAESPKPVESSSEPSKKNESDHGEINLGTIASEALAMVDEVCHSRIDLSASKSSESSNSAPSVNEFARQAYIRLTRQGHQFFTEQDSTLSCG